MLSLLPAISREKTLTIAIYICGLLLLLPSLASSQNRITINRAKEVMGVTMEGERVRKLLGNVSLRTQNMVMFCDSAYQFLEKNEVRAFGNIEINTPDEQIYADTLIYFTDLDFSQLRGRVIIEADSATLYSQAVDYRFSSKVGHFIEHVRLEDPEGTLTANSGFYYREPDSAVFRGDVQISDSLQYAEGDSLFINRRKNSYRLYSNVFVDDRENHVMLKGDSLKADSVGHRSLLGNAWLKKFKPPPDTSRADTANADRTPLSPDSLAAQTTPADTSAESTSSDTTHIQARTIHSYRRTTVADTQAVINAYQNVRIWSPKFAATADTARYNDQTEIFKLSSNPVAWHKQIQLTGPYIEVMLEGDEIDRLTSYPAPFIVQQDTTLDRLHQMTGDTLKAYFTDGDISRIHLYPNSHLFYFTKDNNGQSDGAVDMTSPSIRIFFENGELVEMKAQGPGDGTYLPESEQTAKRRLDGFAWTPDQRPQKPTGSMKRRLPPIPQEISFTLPRRYLEDNQNVLVQEPKDQE
ncbi:MAG: OstA-like protein [Balneolaceae bacterium]|nr:OstA-like protein [Balneolaceae bacterium]